VIWEGFSVSIREKINQNRFGMGKREMLHKSDMREFLSNLKRKKFTKRMS
jgi:hypothetical protein